ncbi:MAG: ATP-binding protein, partial [Bdellovibrionales bacterium]|nr:ATP-binding protein [Bdellovibrionales bacterium]
MDPRTNPYAPGAGTLPPELAGRDELIEKVSIQLDRCRNGLAFRGFLLVGLRGVGKTVLLTRLAQEAEASGFAVVSIETPEKRSLPALLIPALRTALLKLDLRSATTEVGKKALRVLGGFVSAMKVKFEDIEFGLDLGSEPGIADSGDLESDLVALFVEIGRAAKVKQTAVVLFVDEVQYIEEGQFAALIMALHKCTQLQLPITLVGAGLPQLVGQAGRAKSYAERLFEYPDVGPLPRAAAKQALEAPAAKQGVKYEAAAIDEILDKTRCY